MGAQRPETAFSALQKEKTNLIIKYIITHSQLVQLYFVNNYFFDMRTYMNYAISFVQSAEY